MKLKVGMFVVMLSLFAGYSRAQSTVFSLDKNLFKPPLDSVVNIAFITPFDGNVGLVIRNSAGEMVYNFYPTQPTAILANAPQAFTWNGKNKGGDDVASGVYYFQLILGEGVLIRRLLVVR